MPQAFYFLKDIYSYFWSVINLLRFNANSFPIFFDTRSFNSNFINVVVFDYHFAELSQRWKEKEKKNMTWQIDIWIFPSDNTKYSTEWHCVVFLWEMDWHLNRQNNAAVSFFVADSFIPSSQNTTTVSSSVNHSKWHSHNYHMLFTEIFSTFIQMILKSRHCFEHAVLIICVYPIPPNTSI